MTSLPFAIGGNAEHLRFSWHELPVRARPGTA
jgi:hypothetical protein